MLILRYEHGFFMTTFLGANNWGFVSQEAI